MQQTSSTFTLYISNYTSFHIINLNFVTIIRKIRQATFRQTTKMHTSHTPTNNSKIDAKQENYYLVVEGFHQRVNVDETAKQNQQK